MVKQTHARRQSPTVSPNASPAQVANSNLRGWCSGVERGTLLSALVQHAGPSGQPRSVRETNAQTSSLRPRHVKGNSKQEARGRAVRR